MQSELRHTATTQIQQLYARYTGKRLAPKPVLIHVLIVWLTDRLVDAGTGHADMTK